MSDEFYNEPLDNQETEKKENADTVTGEKAGETQRIYRVNEQYVEPQGDSQYRYRFERGTEQPEVKPSQPEKKNSGIGKKIAGVVLAAAVFIAAAGGLMAAAQWLSGDASNGGGSPDTPVAGLTHSDQETQEDNEDGQVEETSDNENDKEGTTTLTKNTSDIATTGTVSATMLDVSAVVEEVMPTVVAVTNTTVYTVSSSYWSWFGNSSSSGRTASGAGSGVILADNGEELLIVTNAHVVNPTDYSDYGYTVDTSEITVTFCNEVTVDAVVKGTDTDADLAVIAVDLDDIDEETKAAIKIATVGNSDQLKVGNGVIAIGNALGFGQSVTVGYISAVNREVTIDSVTRALLQTDAAINPGNSGGGLFDVNGRLIGINSAKYASEDVEGIGYAIPITSAESIITELMNKETVVREKVTDDEKAAWLGIESSSQYNSFYDGQGAFIAKITEGGPADQAGLMAYDIITAINDTDITSWNALVNELAYYEGGETVTVTYYTLVESGRNREYVERTTEVTLGFKKDMPSTDESTEE